MLTFLEPKVLWALPLSALPVILHLIFLRRARRQPFSDLTLLRSAFLRSLPATRLRQWLLMLLRCLALAALIAAFARPVIHPLSAAASGAESGLDALILLDTSWSMRAEVRGKPRFELAAAAGLEFLKLLRPADRVAVAGFSKGLDADPGRLIWSESRSAAGEIMSRLKPGWGTTDIGATLRSAYTFLSGDGKRIARRRAILILSDDSRHLLSSLPAAGPSGIEGYDPETILLGLRWDVRVPNAAVRDAAPEAGALAEKTAIAARAEIFGAERPGTSLDAWLRGRRVEQRVLGLDESAARGEVFQFSPQPDGELYGRFELRRDALPADDAYFFSLKVQPRPRVLYLFGHPNAMQAGHAGYFLRKLLADSGRLPYRFDSSDLGRLGQLRVEDYAAIVLDDCRRIPPEAAETLKRFVLRGGGLWIIAGTQAEPETFQGLSALLPARPDAAAVPASDGLKPADDRASESGPHARLRWSDFDLANVSIRRRYLLEPAPEARVLFRDGAGAPLLIERSFGRGRVLLWASSFDVRWSNAALKPVFVALADVSLARLSGYTGSRRWRTVRVGEPILRVWEPGEAAPMRIEVQAPGGRRTSVLVSDRRASYCETREPGLYFLKPASGGEVSALEAYAVNADRSTQESDLRPGPAPWKSLRPAALREDFLLAVYGKEARTGALCLALLLLALETALANPFLASRKGAAAREAS
ncbi:MAG: BatA domain-containing protein [Elusimicrobia bacterium]|nr:BatA domain-containing protein [Elusimicrobiota bacterium]